MAQAFAAGAMLTMLADVMMPEALQTWWYDRGIIYSDGISGSGHFVGNAIRKIGNVHRVLEIKDFL